jgi:phosphomannomutase
VDRIADAPPVMVGSQGVTGIDDLRPGVGGLPPSDVVRIHLTGGRVIVRPSGTEPKLKAYVEVVEPLGSGDLGSARQRAAVTLDDVLTGLDALLA